MTSLLCGGFAAILESFCLLKVKTLKYQGIRTYYSFIMHLNVTDTFHFFFIVLLSFLPLKLLQLFAV